LSVIKLGFSSNRKKLITNLVAWGFDKKKVSGVLHRLWISENIRWEDLDIEAWCQLIKEL
jgi:16S rRNA A1518/A1519 N6-dimethyltransferase RsmA/KsgA/DIM1 with predicted DNA glycosylase/AP lyase activity